jgi:hypothetical protein
MTDTFPIMRTAVVLALVGPGAASNAHAVDLTDNVLLMSLDDDGAAPTITDASPSSNDGMATGGPVFVTGLYGDAPDFDGIDYHAVVDGDSSTALTSAGAIMAWVNADMISAGNRQIAGAWEHSAGARKFQLQMRGSGQISAWVSPDGGAMAVRYSEPADSLQTGVWTDLA